MYLFNLVIKIIKLILLKKYPNLNITLYITFEFYIIQTQPTLSSFSKRSPSNPKPKRLQHPTFILKT